MPLILILSLMFVSVIRYYTLLALFVAISIQEASYAQSHAVSGTVIQTKDKSPLMGAHVTLRSLKDTTLLRGMYTDLEGRFHLDKLAPGTYLLHISFVGFLPLEKSFTLEEHQENLGTFGMEEDTALLKEVEVQGVRARVEQLGDTTQYNADAFKTNPDANAEDLIAKMPGITRENGTVKAQGEEVKRVLVDGNEFFADDPTLALRNLPAEIIDKVQVYDEMSEQSKFTGFDDGNTQKTINIVTKAGRSNGQFGKVYGGYGTDHRYLGGGNLNFFKGDQRLSVIGLTNNINQQNFSTQDLMGVVGGGSSRRGGPGGRRGGPGNMARRGGGQGGGGSEVDNFLVGPQGGISRTHAFGLNYSDQWGSKAKVNASYFFNGTHNFNNSLLARQYFSENGPGQLYEETEDANSENLNHRFSFRLDYALNEYNSILMNTRFNLQDFQNTSTIAAENTLSGDQLLSKSQNDNASDYAGYDFSNDILFRHRFAKPRRTLSFNLGTRYNRKKGKSSLYSLNQYFQDSDSTLLLNQESDLYSNGYTLSGELSYTEPLGKGGMLMMDYAPSYTQSASDKKTYDLEEGQVLGMLDTALSNIYDNIYLTQRTGVGYMLRQGESNFMLRLNYQHAQLSGAQDFPYALDIRKTFHNLLPMAMWRHRFANGSNLRLFYRTSTDPPSISQLQEVIDNSNPLLLSTGNPDLRQSYTHRLMTRYGQTSAETGRSFFAFLMASQTTDYISNATLIAEKDTVLAEGITLFQGSQLTRPVNLDGYWNIRSFVTYGLPVAPLKSNLNLNTGVSYARTPGLINEEQNLANTYNVNAGFALGSNISEQVDFTVLYSANYNIVQNSLTPELNNNYFYQTTGLKFNWLFGNGFVLDTDLNHTLYTGLSDAYNQQYLLWNAGFGYKFLKNKRGELKVVAFDLLNQNNSITREVTETYIEDNQSQVLNRYFMLTFTYQLRNFVAKADRSAVEEP